MEVFLTYDAEGQGYFQFFLLGKLLDCFSSQAFLSVQIIVYCLCGSRHSLSLFLFENEECFYCTSCLAKLNIQHIVMSFFYSVCMQCPFYCIIETEA